MKLCALYKLAYLQYGQLHVTHQDVPEERRKTSRIFYGVEGLCLTQRCAQIPAGPDVPCIVQPAEPMINAPFWASALCAAASERAQKSTTYETEKK
jgi:hypothetical protein